MKRATIMARADPDTCRGCRVREKARPVYVIHATHRKTTVEEPDCRGCASCADRCPFHTITMVKREESFTIGADVSRFDTARILALCGKAYFHPQQVLCCCVGIRVEEVATAILGGTDMPEEISPRTEIRTDCAIECIQPILRLLEVAGIQPKSNPDGRQWCGETVTAWTMPEKVKQKYANRGSYFDEDRKLLDQMATASREI